jgi:hypothetical protein
MFFGVVVQALGNVRASDPLHFMPAPGPLPSTPGCGELSDETDCACNVHAAGGHLLCHDDVIGNRRVSYIIYLTGEERVWMRDGGQTGGGAGA